jgi:hypothetical protein
MASVPVQIRLVTPISMGRRWIAAAGAQNHGARLESLLGEQFDRIAALHAPLWPMLDIVGFDTSVPAVIADFIRE